MATYKVYLTVKDSYGNTKEIEGGEINVDLATLTPDEVNQIEEALPLEDYLKKSEIDTELDYYATDAEVDHAVEHNEAIKYSDFELLPEEGSDN
jgi:hypothetical protein